VLPVPIRVIEVAPDRNPTVLLAEVFEASRRIFDFLNGIMFVREPRPKTTAPGGPAQARPWSASMMPDPRWLDALKLPDKVVAGLFPAALLVLGLDYCAVWLSVGRSSSGTRVRCRHAALPSRRVVLNHSRHHAGAISAIAIAATCTGRARHT
jgi:hypothetical protein